RVAILPYLEQENLYREFKLDEPWDSPHNSRLIDLMPMTYACPSRANPGRGLTTYQALVGTGAGFEGSGGLNISKFTDGISSTLLVAEARQPVPWTKPDDLPFAPDQPLPELDATHPGGRNVLFGDGSVRFLKTSVAEEVLRALITRAGGEEIAP